MAADDDRCDECGMSDWWFWEFVWCAESPTQSEILDCARHIFSTPDYEPATPDPMAFGRAVVALVVELQRQ